MNFIIKRVTTTLKKGKPVHRIQTFGLSFRTEKEAKDRIEEFKLMPEHSEATFEIDVIERKANFL